MTRVSIIIPCHNEERYISECLDSVQGQTLSDIEIVCIDDGSTDRTASILVEYRKKIKNLRIIQQKNQGSGIARNKGIDEAEGEYIAFMDADDFYPSAETLEKVYNKAKQNNAEICGGSWCTYNNGVYAYEGFKNGLTFSEDGWIKKVDFPTYGGYLRYIYKKELLKDKHIYFPDYLRAQDPPFLLTAVACAGKVFQMKDVTYTYRKGHKQVSYTKRKGIDHVKGIRDSFMISKREGMLVVYRQLLKDLHEELSAMMYLLGENSEEMRGIIRQFNEIIADEIKDGTETPLLEEKEEISKYIKSVTEDIQQLLEDLKKEEKILIYGAGTVGKRVHAFLEENEIAIESFVVSDARQNAVSMDGLQIKCIDDYIDEKDDCMVIIATFSQLHEVIQKNLQEKGFKKVYTLPLEKFHIFTGEVVH